MHRVAIHFLGSTAIAVIELMLLELAALLQATPWQASFVRGRAGVGVIGLAWFLGVGWIVLAVGLLVSIRLSPWHRPALIALIAAEVFGFLMVVVSLQMHLGPPRSLLVSWRGCRSTVASFSSAASNRWAKHSL